MQIKSAKHTQITNTKLDPMSMFNLLWHIYAVWKIKSQEMIKILQHNSRFRYTLNAGQFDNNIVC